MCQYFFNYEKQGFIKFDIVITNIANTFNFYNRSSLKTEMRITGEPKSYLEIASFKAEKKNTQKITNTIGIRLQPGIDDIKRVEAFT